jgi:hypothetical protein
MQIKPPKYCMGMAYPIHSSSRWPPFIESLRMGKILPDETTP